MSAHDNASLVAPSEPEYTATEGSAVPPLAIAHPAVAEWSAMSEVRRTMLRADRYVRVLDEAGMRVLSVDIDAHRVMIQVAPGMVAAAATELGWSAAHEVYGDLADPSERVCATDGPIYAVDRVYGAVSAR